MKRNFKYLFILLILFIMFFTVTAFSYATTISNDLSKNIFRLHILANSDSKEDQELKLKVRDKLLYYMKEITPNNSSKSKIIQIVQENQATFKKIAKQTIKENGYDYDVNIEIGNYYFPTKYYGNISLPAGNYDALKIEIGEAKGQNWWCSLFPPLCFVGVSSGIVDEEGQEYLKENLSDEEFSLISSNSSDIQFKFKIVELINNRE